MLCRAALARNFTTLTHSVKNLHTNVSINTFYETTTNNLKPSDWKRIWNTLNKDRWLSSHSHLDVRAAKNAAYPKNLDKEHHSEFHKLENINQENDGYSGLTLKQLREQLKFEVRIPYAYKQS